MKITLNAWSKSFSEGFSKNLFPHILLWGAIQALVFTGFFSVLDSDIFHTSGISNIANNIIILLLLILTVFVYIATSIPFHLAVQQHFKGKDVKSANISFVEKTIENIKNSKKIFIQYFLFALRIIGIILVPIILYALAANVVLSALPEVNSISTNLAVNAIFLYALSFIVPLFIVIYLLIRLSFVSALFFEMYETKTNREIVGEAFAFSKGKMWRIFFAGLGIGIIYAVVFGIFEIFSAGILIDIIWYGINTVFFYILYYVMISEKEIEGKVGKIENTEEKK